MIDYDRISRPVFTMYRAETAIVRALHRVGRIMCYVYCQILAWQLQL